MGDIHVIIRRAEGVGAEDVLVTVADTTHVEGLKRTLSDLLSVHPEQQKVCLVLL